MQDFRMKLPLAVQNIINTLYNSGYEAFVVGGCVRDSLMGRVPHDYDICTSAKPETVMAIFRGYNVIATGLKHGTVTVVVDNVGYEITTYRVDGVYSDGRRPDTVEYTTDLCADLSRRDFTINAMAYNDRAGLVDIFGGRHDIQNGVIRCVGVATERFNEDALRMMRALRFAAQFEFTIEQYTCTAIHLFCSNLKKIAVERIVAEFNKLLCTRSAGRFLMEYQDVISQFIPEITAMFDFAQNNPYHVYDVYKHTLVALNRCPTEDLIVRLAVLFHDIGKPKCSTDDENGVRHFYGHAQLSATITDVIMQRLRYDNITRNAVVQLVRYHDVNSEVGIKYVKRWCNKIGVEQYKRLLCVREADIKGQNEKYLSERLCELNALWQFLSEVEQTQACFTLKNLAVNGKDLLAIGYTPGKELGAVLNWLLQEVIDGNVANDKNTLLNYIKRKRA